MDLHPAATTHMILMPHMADTTPTTLTPLAKIRMRELTTRMTHMRQEAMMNMILMVWREATMMDQASISLGLYRYLASDLSRCFAGKCAECNGVYVSYITCSFASQVDAVPNVPSLSCTELHSISNITSSDNRAYGGQPLPTFIQSGRIHLTPLPPMTSDLMAAGLRQPVSHCRYPLTSLTEYVKPPRMAHK
jgi:hypothetical protein